MSPWLKPRILALFCGALLIGGATYLHAQEDYGPPSKTPEEAATNFWKLLDLIRHPQNYARYATEEDTMKPLLGSIVRSQFEAMNSGNSERLVVLLMTESASASFEGHVQSSSGNQSIVSVTPATQPKTHEVVVVKDEGGYRVDVVATYARWHHLTSAEADEALFRATGWISPTLAKQRGMLTSGGGSMLAGCQSNLKQLGLGIAQYTQDYDEKLPPARSWQDAVYPYVKSEQIYTCPALGTKKNGYASNSKTSQVTLESLPSIAETVQLYETSNLKRNVFAPFTGRAYRHSSNGHMGMNIEFVDGHVKWFKQGTDHAPFSTTSPGSE